MCGIAGYSGRFSDRLLDEMAEAIAHRGPDGEETLALHEDGIGLAHRRLAIIDLSERGSQPMWDVGERAAVVYNGELYNYRELKSDLLAQGFAFRGDSDTEVLLNLYLRDGPEMLAKLNGIFAFAIWDVQQKQLFLARDGLGVKPLYYASTDRGFLFASELKALLHEPSVERSIDPVAVSHYLTYLWCPSPRTMLRNVGKLPPGRALLVRDGKVTSEWKFYELPYAEPPEALDEREAIDAVKSQIARSVERQLVSDVPVGAFLSGGLDSSAVVAMARRAEPDRPLHCFTIGFDSRNAEFEGMGMDLPYARQVAGHLGVDLHTITVGPEMVDELETMLYHLDEPQADPAPINSLFISRLAREHDIKVLLSGAGGDDIFSGYRRHFALCQERYWSWLPPSLRRSFAALSDRIHPAGDRRRRIAKAFRFAGLEGDERLASYFYWIDRERLEPTLTRRLAWRLFAEDAPDPLVDELRTLPREVSPLNRMLFLDSRFFLADHNLNYVDKTAMAAGVEVRVPLLDPELVALAARLPAKYKQRGSVGKWILREAMREFLPQEILYRPKAGFGAPLRHWLRHDLRAMVDDVLSPASLEKRGLFDPQGVRDLVEQDRRGRVDAAYTIFSMMCIELWCQMFLDPSRPQRRVARN